MLSVLSQDRAAALAQADAIAEKIRSALTEPYRLPTGAGNADGQAFIEHRCSASIGVALFDDRDPAEILRVADAAMYRAKQSGANQVCFSEQAAA
jgi:GGDEF domain-containing protein